MAVRVWTSAVLVLPAMFLSPASALANDKDTPVSWKKTVIEAKFRSEGVGIGDVNKDGKFGSDSPCSPCSSQRAGTNWDKSRV